jgi:hypothetical protein
MKPSLTVNFTDEDFTVADVSNDQWTSAAVTTIDHYWNGELAPEGRRTDVLTLWSDSALYLRFDARQTEPLYLNEDPQTQEKTMELWEHDVCELFLAPDPGNVRRYVEVEIAPTGEWLDLVVDWNKDEPRDWDYLSKMETFARIDDGLVTMAIKLPWSAFGTKPADGDVWLGNLFRQVGFGETRGYLTWSPTMTETPSFHHPEKFGEFVFRR